MNDVLMKIYYGQVEIDTKHIKHKHSEKEEKLYDKLEKILNEKQFDTFQEFLNCYANRYTEYQELAFKQGVKLGFEIAQEIHKIEI